MSASGPSGPLVILFLLSRRSVRLLKTLTIGDRVKPPKFKIRYFKILADSK